MMQQFSSDKNGLQVRPEIEFCGLKLSNILLVDVMMTMYIHTYIYIHFHGPLLFSIFSVLLYILPVHTYIQ